MVVLCYLKQQLTGERGGGRRGSKGEGQVDATLSAEPSVGLCPRIQVHDLS